MYKMKSTRKGFIFVALVFLSCLYGTKLFVYNVCMKLIHYTIFGHMLGCLVFHLTGLSESDSFKFDLSFTDLIHNFLNL